MKEETPQAPKPPPEVKLSPKEVETVHQFRAAVFRAAGQLPEGHPARGVLTEALLHFQINARPELRP